MASFVNAGDAVAAAVEIERRGFAFYTKVAEKATHENDKEFFAFMAGEEKRHESIFETMLKRLGGVALPAGSDDGEYLMYVQGLLDSHTLFTPEQEQRALESPLAGALQFEKDTLIFFMELENMVPDSEKEYVRQCADEERKHIRMLLARK
ncbi:ferritin family protein [Desulfovibrio sp. OttesenSCG-928-G15]|nr:ferritin family protein [Desulfovibrio sp. OttesenSCG-928-G15]